jgi:hypothetical protein
MIAIEPDFSVRLDIRHSREMMRREDVAEQDRLAALALAGRHGDVLDLLAAARHACRGHVEARRIGRQAV